ncbi:MAG: putative sensor protein [Pelosinus sp.]|jgi:sigma-B regulation protein RsbU (phosphoserine phosphatase)|nr:putative sensor protein [Pelosinus sp.]
MSIAQGIFGNMCDYCQRFELFNMLNEALLLIDSESGQILFMNQKALDLYQYTEEEFLKLSMNDIANSSMATLRENMDLAKKYKKGHIFITNHVKKDGVIFKVEVSARYMTLHGTLVFATVIRNLTPDGKMREEIQIAGKVQHRMLPRDLENELFRIRSVYQPHHYVSGDLYDFVYEEKSQMLFGIVIDVMGHGVAAALQTSILKYLFMKAIEKNITIKDRLVWINKEVMPFFAGGQFAGVFLFEFDFMCNTLTYSAGGINHFIILNHQGPQIIKTPGLFLGIKDNEEYDQGSYHFRSGESFLFLTDGLFERLAQPMDQDLDFWSLHEMCKKIVNSGECRDDASGVGILVR